MLVTDIYIYIYIYDLKRGGKTAKMPSHLILLLCAQGDHKMPDQPSTCAKSEMDPVQHGQPRLTLQL